MPQLDPARRHAARIATLIAVPVAVAVAAFGLWRAGVFEAAPQPSPSASVSPVPTTPVTVAAPSLSPTAAGVCRTIVAKLPGTLHGAARRPVSAGPEQNAAYGEPPVTLACGVAPLRDLDPTALVTNLGGVCWFGQVAQAGMVWTTVDREIAVAVTVPGPKDGSAQSVIPFSAAIGAADPILASAPSGCTG